jgi:hypothetical protein
MAISDLAAVVPPPSPPVHAEIDWDTVEQRLGLPLPQDYKDFIARYGQGSFDDFLHPYQPATGNEYLDLVHRQQIDLGALRTLQRDFGEDIPYRVGDPAELLPVALTDNGDIVYWHVRDPKDPDSWTITVNESRGPEWFRYDGSFTSFLADVLARRIRVSVFPDDFPDPVSVYVSHDA